MKELRINLLAKMLQNETDKYVKKNDGKIDAMGGIVYIEIATGITILKLLYPYFPEIMEMIKDENLNDVLKRWYDNQSLNIEEPEEEEN